MRQWKKIQEVLYELTRYMSNPLIWSGFSCMAELEDGGCFGLAIDGESGSE